MVTARDAVLKFVRSRVIDTHLDGEDVASLPSWVQDAHEKAIANLPDGSMDAFNDRWASEYTDDLLASLASDGFDVTVLE